MIAQWFRENETCGDASQIAGPANAPADAMRNEELAQLVFGRWCDLVKGPISARATSE
jgi:hypothetical protein